MLKKDRAFFILNRLNEIYPETPIPLHHKNKFELLIAVLLSAQCTDERVNQVTPKLFAIANNAKKMMEIPVKKIASIIRPCGLAPQKSTNISNLSKIIVEKHNSKVPEDFISLENLFLLLIERNILQIRPYIDPTSNMFINSPIRKL